MFLLISTHFTATPGIPLSSPELKLCSFKGVSMVEPLYFTSDLRSHLRALTPNESEQRLLPPCYRGCWHGVSRSFLWWYRQATRVLAEWCFFPPDRVLRSKDLHHPRDVARSGFPPLPKPLDCCLPQESGPYLSPSVADHSLKPATHRCLGRPLPYQQANRTRDHF